MEQNKPSFAAGLVRPKIVRVALLLWGLFTGYDTLSNQLDLPKLRKLFGMSGPLLPWWGWLLVLQAILIAALFEYVRRNIVPNGPEEDLAPGIGELEIELQRMGATIREIAEDRKKIINDYQRMSALEGKIQTLAAALAGLPEKAEAIRVDGVVALREIEKLKVALEAEHRQRQASFYALETINELDGLEQTLESDASELYDRLHGGATYDLADWQSWESVNAHWEDALNKWAERAQWYAHSVKQRIFTVEERDFNGHWSVGDAQFPSADAQRRFKRHRILWRKWQIVREDVKQGVRSVAFSGMAERDVVNGSAAKFQQ